MTTIDLLTETWSALSANVVRTGLTMLGVVIGIGSVIAMIAVGTGAQGAIEANIQALGSNLIIVLPGAQRGAGIAVSGGRGSARSLASGDADAIRDVPGVRAVAPEVSGRYQVIAHGTNTNTQVVGTTDAYPDVRAIAIATGTFLTPTHLRTAAKVAVLGPTTRDDLFGEGTDAVGKTLRIRNLEFTVIGVTAPKGGSGFNSPDDLVFIPITAAQRYLTGDTYLTTIGIQAIDASAMRSVQDGVTTTLLDRHHIADQSLADFSTLNQADIVAAASSVTGTFTTLLAAIAGISLLVGGIGIMNMMLTTVTERTREIGLRKAVGATRREMSQQFLTEAIAVTGIGGVAGVLLGWVLARVIAQIGGIPATVTLSSTLLALGVAAGIGIIFGYYPARRAAALHPIVALRYE